jgi:hypothetical protein
MATIETLAREKVALEARRDEALAMLASRAGDEAPKIRDVSLTRFAHDQREHMLGVMTLTTFALAQLQTLTAEVDALKAQVAALSGKKGT